MLWPQEKKSLKKQSHQQMKMSTEITMTSNWYWYWPKLILAGTYQHVQHALSIMRERLSLGLKAVIKWNFWMPDSTPHVLGKSRLMHNNFCDCSQGHRKLSDALAEMPAHAPIILSSCLQKSIGQLRYVQKSFSLVEHCKAQVYMGFVVDTVNHFTVHVIVCLSQVRGYTSYCALLFKERRADYIHDMHCTYAIKYSLAGLYGRTKPSYTWPRPCVRGFGSAVKSS